MTINRHKRERIIARCLDTPKGREALAREIDNYKREVRGRARDAGVDPTHLKEVNRVSSILQDIIREEERMEHFSGLILSTAIALIAGMMTGAWLAERMKNPQGRTR